MLGHWRPYQLTIGTYIATLDSLQRSPAPRAMKHHAISLVRAIGGEQVVGDHPVLILDRRMQRVLDVDRRTEHTAVAEISVMAFVVCVKRAQMIARRDIQLDAAWREGRTGGTPLATITETEGFRSLRPVEDAAPARGDQARHAAQPPVEQIEVMRRLVHEQATGICLVAMPAAEIVGAVMRVELPLEIDRGDMPDDARLQHLLQQGTRRRIAVVEGDCYRSSARLSRCDNPAAGLGIDRQRLLGDHIGAKLQRTHDIEAVRVIRDGHNDTLGRRFSQHAVKIVSRVNRHLDAGIRRDRDSARKASRIGIAKADQAAICDVCAEQGMQKRIGTMAEPDDGVAVPHARWVADTLLRRMPGGIASPCASIRSSTIARISVSVSALAACRSSTAARYTRSRSPSSAARTTRSCTKTCGAQCAASSGGRVPTWQGRRPLRSTTTGTSTQLPSGRFSISPVFCTLP